MAGVVSRKSKRKNKRIARKRALRSSNAAREPMSAARRNWGRGEGSYVDE